MTTRVFWIDHGHDKAAASDGISRYGAYVRDRIAGIGGFGECWDGTWDTRLAERFAACAWETATSPVMAPPYAHSCRQVLSARLWVDADDDAGLIAAVTLAGGPWPPGMGRIGGRAWRPWPHDRSWGEAFPREPYGSEIAAGGYALASLQLLFTVPASILPAVPRPRRGEPERAAAQAVTALVDHLNEVTGPVLAALERS